MKNIFKKVFAVVIAAAAMTGTPVFPKADDNNAFADDVTSVNIHFDLSGEGVSVEEDEDGNPLELNDIVTDPNSYIKIPNVKLVKEGFSFAGWTVDGIEGFPTNSVFGVGDEDVTLEPVWVDPKTTDIYKVDFSYEIDGVEQELPKYLQKVSAAEGMFIEIPVFKYTYPDNSRVQMAWIYEGKSYESNKYIIMPDHDIKLSPDWYMYYHLLITAGDVDRLNGAYFNEFDRLEKISFQTPEASRFSRSGFEIVGWLCDYDDQVYGTLSDFVMPSADTTLTAVWKPITYTVVFKPSTKASDNIKIKGETDTAIICPENTVTKDGYYFAGWKFNDDIYQPGDEFVIPGALPGMGILLNAVWEKGTPPTTEEKTIYGDANCDDDVQISDAVLIMQVIANRDKYGVGGTAPDAITARGLINADCYLPGSDLTSMDALAIQKRLLDLCPELPILSAE